MSFDEKWINRLLCKKGKGFEYLCQIEDEFMKDKFNLTGLERDFKNFHEIHESLFKNEISDTIIREAFRLYGLIHSRYIISPNGLSRMYQKYSLGHFGQCHRLLCNGANLLPVSYGDRHLRSQVILFCPNCEDLYVPDMQIDSLIDGTFFGASFPHILLLTYPYHKKSQYSETLSLFGFKLSSLKI